MCRLCVDNTCAQDDATQSLASNTVKVTVDTLPVCTIAGVEEVCPSTSGTVFSAPAGLSYSWSVSGGGSINGGASGQTVSLDASASCNTSYTVSVSITDGNLCNATCNKPVTVIDNIAPVFTGSISSTTIEGCNVGDAPAAVNTVAALEALTGNLEVSDACTADGSLVVTSSQTNTGTCPIVITRTYKVTDLCGNTSVDIIHTINVDDTTAPAVSGSISNTTVEGCSGGNAPSPLSTVASLEALPGDLEISDGCTSDVNLVVTSSQTSSGTCPIVITRTYKVTDLCSNTSVDIIHTIHVDDTTPPVVTGSISTTTVEGCVEGDAPSPLTTVASLEALTGDLGIADVCTSDGSLSVSSSQTSAGTCPIVITRTYNVTDLCGNTSVDIIHTINVDDTIAPVATGSISNTTVEGCDVSAAPSAVTTVVALESLTGDLAVSDACSADGDLVVSSSQTNTGTCPIVITRIYKVTDQCGNTSANIIHTINVDDTTAPVVTGSISETTVEGCDIGAVPSAVNSVAALEALTGDLLITDACYNDASLVVSSSQTSTGSCPIVVTRTYKVTDLCGNTSVDIIHSINVDDSTSPVVTGSLSSTTVEGCVAGDAPTPLTTVASLEALAGDLEIIDACTVDASLTVTSSETNSGTCPIVITRTYKVTDICGNTSVDIIHTINVDDTTAPMVTGSISNISVEGCSEAAAPGPLTTVASLEGLPGDLEITDACTNDAELVVTSSQTSTGTCPIVITRTYKVTDLCDNTSIDIIHTINVDDTTPPVVTGSLSSSTVEGCDTGAAPSAVTTVAALEALIGDLLIADACSADGNLSVSSSQTSTGTCPIVITRTYKVTDECGNTSADIIHVINIEDTTAPAVSGSISSTTVEGCNTGAAPAPLTTVASLEALAGDLEIVDACTIDANLVVTNSQSQFWHMSN